MTKMLNQDIVKNKNNKVRLIRGLACSVVAVILLSHNCAHAQLTNIQSIYFQNQYLANPALAGMEPQLNLNMDYHQQWIGVPGSPTLTTFTADYNSGNKVGLGLNVYGNNAGLISRTRIMGTYAYHIPLNDKGAKLSLGLSIGFSDAHINEGDVVGDQGDLAVSQFNSHGVYADGDIGVAYISPKFNAQLALPNLKRAFFQTQADAVDVEASTFYAAMSYKLQLTYSNNYSIYSIEPKVAYRGIMGYSNVFDVGFNLYRTTFEDNYQLNLQGIYHSDNSLSWGFGIDYHTLGLLFSYTYNTGPLSSYANNTFELGISLKLLKKTTL
jgi:type IX secretion system PorP/SprF family membrane protein